MEIESLLLLSKILFLNKKNKIKIIFWSNTKLPENPPWQEIRLRSFIACDKFDILRE